MKHLGKSGCWRYHLVERPREIVRHDDHELAKDYLSWWFSGDACVLEDLREIVGDWCWIEGAEGFTEEQIFDQIAREMVDTRLGFLREEALPLVADPVAPREKKPVPIISTPEGWITFRMIDQASKKPVSGIELAIKKPDGSLSTRTSRNKGLIELEDIVSGSCEVSCDLKEARLWQTVTCSVVSPAKRDGQSKSKTSRSETPLTARCIAEVKAYQVKTGDTLESIAKSANMTWQELSLFNWGTDKPEAIEEHLSAFVGCTKKTQDGKRYQLDDSDRPGLIYLPRLWRKKGLQTEQIHTLEVSQVALSVRMLIHLDVDDPKTQDDTLIFTEDGGSWRHTIPVSGLSEVEPDWIDLVFPRPPQGCTFTLTHDLGKDGVPLIVFEKMPEEMFWQSGAGALEVSEKDDDDEHQEESS